LWHKNLHRQPGTPGVCAEARHMIPRQLLFHLPPSPSQTQNQCSLQNCLVQMVAKVTTSALFQWVNTV
jgi:hypothetical protein